MYSSANADDRELRQPVRVGGRLDEQRRALDEVLEGQLDHRAETALEVDDPLAVREGAADAVVGGAASDLVDGVKADPDHKLEAKVRPTARQAPIGRCRDGGHRTADSTPSRRTLPGHPISALARN